MPRPVPILRAYIENGQIIWWTGEARRFQTMKKHLEGKDVEITIRKKQEKRTTSQNSYLHLLIHILGTHVGYDDDEMKEALKWKYLKVHTDSDIPTVRSTAVLNTAEMTEFIDNIKRFGAELGCYLPDPGESE